MKTPRGGEPLKGTGGSGYLSQARNQVQNSG